MSSSLTPSRRQSFPFGGTHDDQVDALSLALPNLYAFQTLGWWNDYGVALGRRRGDNLDNVIYHDAQTGQPRFTGCVPGPDDVPDGFPSVGYLPWSG
jgi:hypothetical protein